MEPFEKYRVNVLDQEAIDHTFPNHTEAECNHYIQQFAEKAFTEKNFIGEGNTARVYRHPEKPELCIKHIHSLNEQEGNVHPDTETDLMNDVRNLHTEVIVPDPIALVTTPFRRNSKKELVKEYGLVMEYIDGITLEELERTLASEESVKVELPENFNAEIFFKILKDFLIQIHTAQIYHRDIHAGNIMIHRKTGAPVVLDFGKSIKTFLSEENPYVAQDEIRGTVLYYKNDLEEPEKIQERLQKVLATLTTH